jgi:dihydrofolate reductase
MTKVMAAMSTSLDGFVAGADDSPEQGLGVGGEALFEWLFDGDTPSRHYNGTGPAADLPSFRMSAVSARFFDDVVDQVGAGVTGRRTYDNSHAWGGSGPVPGRPLFVMTHSVPDDVPEGDPPYTFVTDGIENAVAQAKEAAQGKDMFLQGASIIQQGLTAGLLDELTIHLVPVVLGRGVRLLDGLDAGSPQLELIRVLDAPGVTHLSYRVVK